MDRPHASRVPYVAVVGPSDATEEEAAAARAVGGAVAQRGAVLVCGARALRRVPGAGGPPSLGRVPEPSRSPLALCAAAARAILLLGARYLHRSPASAPAAPVATHRPAVRVDRAQDYGAIVHVAGAVR